MNRNLNIFLWFIFFALMAPSGMALASWNAVPGDNTYGMKLALEKVLLFVISPSNELESTTNSKLTERRMGEVTKVLSGVHAKESLDNLTQQIAATRESLSGIDNEQAKREAIIKYIETLHQVTNELEQQKLNRAIAYLPPQRKTTGSYKISNRPPTQTTTTTTTTNTTTTKPAVNYVNNYYYVQPNQQQPTQVQPTTTQPTTTQPTTTQPTQTTYPTETIAPTTEEDLPTLPTEPPPAPEEIIQPDVVDDINDTQEEIDDVIEELEEIAQEIPPAPSASQIQEVTPTETQPESQVQEQERQQGRSQEQSQGQGQTESQSDPSTGE